jgi:hypothetical protein
VAAPVAGGATYSGSVGELLLDDTRAALGSIGLLLDKSLARLEVMVVVGVVGGGARLVL